MNEETKNALEGSIAKWKAIEEGHGEDHGLENCPLCKLFHTGEVCDGCPVKEETGKDFCEGTPYEDWHSIIADTPALKALARAEREFLESLREE